MDGLLSPPAVFALKSVNTKKKDTEEGGGKLGDFSQPFCKQIQCHSLKLQSAILAL